MRQMKAYCKPVRSATTTSADRLLPRHQGEDTPYMEWSLTVIMVIP